MKWRIIFFCLLLSVFINGIYVFAEEEIAMIASMPEAAPEPTPEVTPEQTPEPTPEVTPDQTPEPTPEPAPDQTPEPTPEPAPEQTPKPTPEVMSEPIQEAIPEPVPEPTAEPLPQTRCHLTQNDGVDESWVVQCNQQLDRVPDSVLRLFQDEGWTISVTSIDIDAVHYNGQYGSVMGSADPETHTILIEDRENAIREATIHEMGHFLDFYFGNPSLYELQEIYAAEAQSYASYFAVDFYYDEREFYADSFYTYITQPDGLAVCAPCMYYYWADTLETLEG